MDSSYLDSFVGNVGNVGNIPRGANLFQNVPNQFTTQNQAPTPNLGLVQPSFNDNQQSVKPVDDYDGIDWLKPIQKQSQQQQQLSNNPSQQISTASVESPVQSNSSSSSSNDTFKVNDLSIFDGVVTESGIRQATADLVKNNQLNFFNGVDPQDLAALHTGDFTKLNNILSNVATNAMSEAILVALRVTGSQLPKMLDNSFDQFTKFTGKNQIDTAIRTADPIETRIKQVFAEKYLEYNPKATPSQVNDEVNKAYRAYSKRQADLLKPPESKPVVNSLNGILD